MNVRFLLSLALLSSAPFAFAQTSTATPNSATSSSARKSGAVVHQDFGQVKADRHTEVRAAAPSTSNDPHASPAQSEIKPRDAATGMPTGRRMAKPDTSTTGATPLDAAKIKSHSNQSNNRTENTTAPKDTSSQQASPHVATPQDAAKIKSHSNQTNN